MMMRVDKCLAKGFEDDATLSDIAHLRNRSLEDLLRQVEFGESDLREKANKFARERRQEERRKQAEYVQRLKHHEEQLSYQIMEGILQDQDIDEIVDSVVTDQLRKELAQKASAAKYKPNELTVEDLQRSLQEYIDRGELHLEQGRIRITPKGARKLASQVLRKIFKDLVDPQMGPHAVEEIGYGPWISPTSRKYEPGDDYAMIDFEKTLLNALERKSTTGPRLKLEPEHFEVYDEVHETKMVAGMIIDQSGSMSGEKFNAALDTSLALAELIRREPDDSLKVYLFSHHVKEIAHYDIANAGVPQGFTDIKAALYAFRRETCNAKGDRQAYLITDSEPNTEDGKFVGFDKATAGVLHEALHYRQAGITLNLIMLDQSPKLRQLASVLARQNLGRVFFTCPARLGEVLVEDYLTYKKRMVKNSR
jgi:uncharacterized protein with von Willebrand factor type A (vWA) domain